MHKVWHRLGGVLTAVAAFHAAGAAPAPAQVEAQVTADADSQTVDLSNLRAPLAVEHRLRRIERESTPDFAGVIKNGTVHLGAFSLAEHDNVAGHLLVVRGNADVYGDVRGNLVTLDGNVTVHRGGSVHGDVVAFNGTVNNDGDITGTVRSFGPPLANEGMAPVTPKRSALALTGERLAGTISTFLSLLALGIAFVLLARPKLEIVADTASHSFARSLLAGFIGQVLLLPTLGVLVVGLIVSIVGILLLPFAVTGFALLVTAGAVGGFVAVAHTLGEVYTRRRLAAGNAVSANSYRYVGLGIGALAVPCLIAALFGWVPVVGPLLRTVAFLIVWLALTAGFGAMMLSRGGKRTTFAGWTTP